MSFIKNQQIDQFVGSETSTSFQILIEKELLKATRMLASSTIFLSDTELHYFSIYVAQNDYNKINREAHTLANFF